MSFIAFTSGGSGTATVSSITATIPAGTINGGTLLLGVSSSTSIGTPTGWTLETGFPTPNTSSAGRMNVFSKASTTSDAGTTFTITPSAAARVVWAIGAYDNAGVNIAAGSTATTASNALNAPNISATVSGGNIVCFFGTIHNTAGAQVSSVTSSGGTLTIRGYDQTTNASNRNVFIAMGDNNITATGSQGVKTVSVVSVVQQGTGSIALLPTGVAPPTTSGKFVRIGGTFVEKPVLVKSGGVFVQKPVNVRIGSIFYPA